MLYKPKKYLGQNFLIDKNIQRKIISACDFQKDDTVLEIGSGRGELTHYIKDKVAMLYALEIDRALYVFLKKEFEGEKKLKIINKDILKFNINKFFPKTKNKIKVFGNIPYYITSPIIECLLKFKDRIDSVYLTVQKEFALRIVAKPGPKDYGSFSCFVQYQSIPKILFFIKKNSFYPAPKVDSCFLRLAIRLVPAVHVNNEKLFFKIIRSAFNQRRKTLRNSLVDIVSKDKLSTFFLKFSLSPDIRPERLSLQDFANLANL